MELVEIVQDRNGVILFDANIFSRTGVRFSEQTFDWETPSDVDVAFLRDFIARFEMSMGFVSSSKRILTHPSILGEIDRVIAIINSKRGYLKANSTSEEYSSIGFFDDFIQNLYTFSRRLNKRDVTKSFNGVFQEDFQRFYQILLGLDIKPREISTPNGVILKSPSKSDLCLFASGLALTRDHRVAILSRDQDLYDLRDAFFKDNSLNGNGPFLYQGTLAEMRSATDYQ